MSMNRRVVVTGLGVVSPLGSSVETAWENLLAGKSGIRRSAQFEHPDYRCKIAGEVSGLELEKYLAPKEQQRLDTFCHYAVAAGDQALEQAGLKDGGVDPTRAGVLVSSGIGGLATITTQVRRLTEAGPRQVSPMTIPMMISDMACGFLGLRYNFQGPNFGVVSACATGLHSIGEASWVIKRGDADVMLCGGAEASVIELGQAGFGSMRALCSSHNDDPEHASRPFDAERDGFIPGAGAGVLVLEDLEHALGRGATILAEVAGYGASCDAHHITAPCSDGRGAAAAVTAALRHAGLQPEDIGYINAHGTSTPMNDIAETRALKLALGDHAYKAAVSSTKSMTGHMLGAAGGFESVVCIQGLLNKIVPGTMNLNTPDPECDLDYCPNAARELPNLRHALKLNMGFGGHNAAVIYSAYQA